jgi:hypothetical protein
MPPLTGANTSAMRAFEWLRQRLPRSRPGALVLAFGLGLGICAVQAQNQNSSPTTPPPPAPSASPSVAPEAVADALVFDALVKELEGKPGETSFTFTFAFTNHAPSTAVIDSVRTSCGCTIAKVPSMPWTIPAGGRGDFSVVLDGTGKQGLVSKSVWVSSSLGSKALTVRALVAENPNAGVGGNEDRLRNMQIAQADRFTIFRGECASCHAKPAEGRLGAALYLSACAICHDSHNRASMAPDLRRLGHPTDREHWIKWITFGRHGSLMPAFAFSEGGILSDFQVDSLVDYLSRTLDGLRLLPPVRPLTGSAESQAP